MTTKQFLKMQHEYDMLLTRTANFVYEYNRKMKADIPDSAKLDQIKTLVDLYILDKKL